MDDELASAALHYNINAYYRSINQSIRAALRGERLRVGDTAPEVSLQTLSGDPMGLDDLVKDGHVALIFGCRSAPPFLAELPALEALHHSAPASCSIVCIYTREIHPNENSQFVRVMVPPHRSINDKTEQARHMVEEFSLTIPVCVDDLEGTTHRLYGMLPESQVVIDRDKTVVHIGEWASATQLRGIFDNLAARDADKSHGRPRLSYSETLWFAGTGKD